MKKNDEYIVAIEDIGNDGEGIGHLPAEACGQEDMSCAQGLAVFVKDTVVGDVVRIGITKIKKTYAYGRVIEVIEPSSYREAPRCENARRCGGCSLMHMSYEKQLDYKWNKVRSCMERIGGIADAASYMEPICGMKEPFYYRNKMQFPVGLSKDGSIEIGFYAGRTHSIIDMDTCAIGHPVNDYIVRALRPLLAEYQNQTGKIIYHEEAHTGVLRHILTRVGFSTGELMVCFVVNANELSIPTERIVAVLEEAVDAYNAAYCQPEDARMEDNRTAHCIMQSDDEPSHSHMKIKLTSVSININKDKTNRILGDTCKTLWGSDTITDTIGAVKFSISPMSFYQVNPLQTKVLYDKAVEYAGLTGNEIVWDMYCGIGTISLSLALHAKKVYGVEIVPQAIADAKENAGVNGVTNTEFFCGKAEEVVPRFYAEAQDTEGCHPDVVVVDPPRKGCDGALLETIAQMNPRRMVYVSCDPATLARDIKILVEKGFSVEKICPVDQFPWSTHVECVTLLQRKNTSLILRRWNMGNYIKLQLENILTEGQTVAPEYCDKKYVIYYNPKETRQKVRINTDYYQNDNTMMLCKSYDRGLCDTIEEYEKLDLKYIESQAYGSWMDGAR
ncbi:MAG: 23S rRNA (uracil(1939)-C(5))-methyltransferase RlmD [Lachnospiraceae bacterium]|nr:23S rRNA (uracil(1939)-C(5))-methyltransferase RlmD [Lachnospiraceae bacterium]